MTKTYRRNAEGPESQVAPGLLPDEERSGPSVSPDADSEHFTVQVTNMPPTEIVCNCGARFVASATGIEKMRQHMGLPDD